MACEESEASLTALTASLAGPKKVRGDAGLVEMHSVSELIEAHRYLSSICAATPGAGRAGRGIRITKLIPPGGD